MAMFNAFRLNNPTPNPNQPRRDFDASALLELTQSIERDGIIQPIIVRKTGPKEYQIIAGERRWRAAKAAGLTQVPVIARAADDQQVLELAIVENIQREDPTRSSSQPRFTAWQPSWDSVTIRLARRPARS